MASFPSVTPTSMDFRAPSFAVRRTVALSGASSRRIFGNLPYNAQLSMTFANVPDGVALLILQCWNAAKGSLLPVTLPPAVFDGAAPALISYLQSGPSMRWHFLEEPSLVRVVPGVSTVSVSMEASLDAS